MRFGTMTFKENDFPYFQDFRFPRGIPAGVEFEAEYTRKDRTRIRLTAPGYGGKPYGNGAIYVSLKDLSMQ